MSLALVTGATGFIGSNLVRVLLEKGRQVRVLVRPTSNLNTLKDLDVQLCFGDIRNLDSVLQSMQGCNEVYHVAAQYCFWARDPAIIHETNVDGTRNICEAALKTRVNRLVYTSTIGTVLNQNHSDIGAYKRSKIAAEELALSYVRHGLPVVVVNPTAPIGPWDSKPTPTGQIIVNFVNGRLPAYVETGLNVVHVRDVAVGHVLAAEKGKIGQRYLLGNANLSLKDILEIIGDLCGRQAPQLRIPYSLAYLTGLISTKFSDWVTHREPAVALDAVKMSKIFMYVDCSKSIAELGIQQTPPRKAFEDALQWFSEHGYINGSQSSLGKSE